MVNSSQKVLNKTIGQLGESLACKYLVNRGLKIIERNYWRKWGELDVVARETSGKVHFVEVKSVSHETKVDLEREVTRLSASRPQQADETWRPEEQVHQFKLHQIQKAVHTWLSDHNYEGDWQIDVIAIRMVPREKYATVKYIENVTL